jgi:hypothetical protein
MEYNSFMEALKGKQHKIDKNKNGKVDSHDFELLRKEETESLDEASTTTKQRTDTNRPTYDVHSKATGNRIGTIYTPSKTNPKHQTTVYDTTGAIHKRAEHDSLKDAHDFIKTSRNIKEETEELDEIHRMKTKLNTLDNISNKSVARQKLSNLMKSGKARGALIANKMRTLNMGDDLDQEDLDALHEVLSKDAKAGDWISDFVHSTNPKFDGKSKKERINMALGAYYDTQKKKDGISEGYQSHSGRSHGNPYGGGGFGRREREDDEYHVPDPTPVAPVPAKKYIKGTPENQALKASRKPINGHPTNEEAEQIEEKSDQAKQNKTMKNMMDASRGARYKLNNPVPDADPEHKTAQAHNKAIGRALRNEDKMTTTKDNSGKLIGFKYEGDWKKSTENKQGSGKAANLAGQAMQKMAKANESKDEQEYGYEGDMALNQLATLTRCAEMIKEILKPDTDMPEWVQSKITLATDYIQTAADYMHSEMNEAKSVEVKVNHAGDEPHEEKWEPVKKIKKPVAEAVQKVDIPAYLRKAKGDTPLKMDDLKRKDTLSDAENLKRNRGVKESFDDEGNLISNKVSYKEFMLEYTPGPGGVTQIKGRSYGANYSDPEGADDADDNKPMKPAAEKRGRGRPAGAKSGARKITGTSKLMNK